MYRLADELYHYGVLGMKWGVRRYQSYEQKPRKSGKGGKEVGAAKKVSHEELTKSTDPNLLYEHKDELSDQELQNRLNRLNMEKQLKNFTNKEKSELRKNFEKALRSMAVGLAIKKIKDILTTEIAPMLKVFTDIDASGKASKMTKEQKKKDKQAQKDAKEFARAKMSTGEGAGNRRKLIKAKIEERSKDPEYKEMFDKYLADQDMAKHAKAAERERTLKDTAKTTKQTAKNTIKFINMLK